MFLMKISLRLLLVFCFSKDVLSIEIKEHDDAGRFRRNTDPSHSVKKRSLKSSLLRLNILKEESRKQLEKIQGLKKFFYDEDGSGKLLFREPSVKQRKSKSSAKVLHLSSRILKLEYLKDLTKRAMKDVVLVSDKIPKINGRKYFTNVTSFESLTSKQTFTGKINGNMMVGTLMDNLVKSDDQRQIKSTKWFKNEVSTQELRPIFLNKIKLSKYVRDPEKVIDGAIFLNGLSVTQSVHMQKNATIFGHKVTTDLVKLEDDISVDECTIEKVTKADGSLLNVTKINGRRFLDILKTHLKSKHLMLKEYDIRSTVTIRGDLRAATVMGLTQQEISSEVELKTGRHVIHTGVFRKVAANMTIPYFSEDNPENPVPTRRSSVMKIHASKFKKLVVDDLLVRGSIGGRHFSELVNLDSNEIIDANVYFKNGIKVIGNLDSESKLIDGIAINPSYTTSFPHNVVIQRGNISLENLYIKGTINGYDFTKIYDDLVKDNGASQDIYGSKIVKDITSDNVQLNSLNGEDFSAYINLKRPSNMTKKTISKKVFFHNITVEDKLNDKPIKYFFANKMYLNKQYNLTGKSFDEVQCQTLRVVDKVNSIPTDSFISKHSSATVKFPVVIARPEFHDLRIENVWTPTDSTFSTIQLNNSRSSEHISSRLLDDIEVVGDLTVLSSLECIKLNNLATSSILNVLKKNSIVQHVKNLHPNKLVVTSAVISDPTMDSRVIRISDSGITRINNFSSWENISLPSINVNGMVNGINLRSFALQAMISNNSLNYISGKKTFTKGFTVSDDWEVKQVNQKSLKAHGLTINTEQRIDQPVEFDAISANNLNIHTFNDQVVPKTLKGSAIPIVFPKSLHLFGTPSARTLRVKHTFNGLNIQEDEKDWINLSSSKNKLIGKISLGGNVRMKSLEVVNLNGIPSKEWIRKIPGTSSNIPRNLTSSSTIFLKNASIKELRTTNNDPVLHDLQNRKMRFTDVREYNSKTFENLVVNGSLKFLKLNGKDLKEEYIHTEEDQVFSHPWAICAFEASDINLKTSWRGLPIPDFRLKNKTLIRSYKEFPFKEEELKISGNLTSNIVDMDSEALVFEKSKYNAKEIKVKGTLETRGRIYVSSLDIPNSITGLTKILGKPFLQILKEIKQGRFMELPHN